MTYSSDRLDRMEALLASTIEGLSRTEKIVESNARAIEAWGDRIEDGIAEAEEVSSSMAANTNRRMEEAITDTVQMIANLGQQQQETDQRFEVFLAEARADRAEMRAAREANSTEHRAFTQNIQVLLAEIARLWQRVAG
ncbi:hypothetical protein VB780_13760 [Leptolyngbya sp. CCNP1308]|uniref:hypothetical protein n=1 Tax=Leptolyngbya sp. CCNP1308 TaxID=3110255 RepID=UPI002B1F21A3|nr:hypothetical protein [Leptolyngbya sp. CCNP1308]MEA5449646.1 hypothetical protein [Leptolyngbya sp. CCNP1308]